MLAVYESSVPLAITHLLQYVEQGLKKRKCVLSTHIIALAAMTGVKLTRKVTITRECEDLPLSFINPKEFSNIRVILDRAK